MENSVGIKEIWTILEAVPDPEIPVLSVVDLGIIRQVEIYNGSPIITITPTYTGCPAMDTIESDILTELKNKGYPDPKIKTTISPAWTTDWISEKGLEKLEKYGIAPPAKTTNKNFILGNPVVKCPQCKSVNTIIVSNFGSTACKALYKCNNCLEPFDYFKCL